MPRQIRDRSIEGGASRRGGGGWLLVAVLSAAACYPNADDLRAGSSGGGVGGGPSSCTGALPQYCPALDDATGGCFPAGTACSTLVGCGDTQFSCRSPAFAADCVATDCITASACPSFVDGTALENCSAHKCCSLWVACAGDAACAAAEPGPVLDQLVECTVNYCGELAESGNR